MDLKEFRDSFTEVRMNSNLWGQFEFDQEESDKKRYAAGKELQYSLCDDDYEFVKFLLVEEVKARATDTFQGFGDGLILLSYLVATYKKPENVLLFEKAKGANFDTFCGYDAKFIFSAGIEPTYGYLRTIKLTHENGYLFKNNQLINTEIQQSDIDVFFDEMSASYPKNPDDEKPIDKLKTALILKEEEVYKTLFKKVEDLNELDDRKLSYYAGEIGYHEKEIFYLQRRFESAENNFDKVHLLTKISQSYLKSTDPLKAYDVFTVINSLLDKFDDWKTLGIGRSVVHHWIRISSGLHEIGEDDLGRAAYLRANSLIWVINNLSCDLLIDANKVVNVYGSRDDSKKYCEALIEEKVRIDSLLL